MNSFVSKSRFLVVGGAGFVGSNLVRTLLDKGAKEIVVIDNLLSSEKENLPQAKEIIFIQGSITDDNILSQISDEFDYIFHLATFHGNQNSIYDPLADHENNTLTTLKLFNHIKDFKRIKKVVYSGAGCAVAKKGMVDNVSPVKEDEPISFEMDSPYSISKLIGEFYSVYFWRRFSLPVVRARFQNVYGPWEVLGAGKWRGTPATVWRNVIPTFIYKALKNEPLPVENKGIATRDFIYVEDIVKGLLLCALKGEAGDVYNLATGRETSILELAKLINELTGNKAGIIFLPKRDWDSSIRRIGSTLKAKEKLGFTALVDIKEGLKKTIKWTQEHIDYIERNISKHRPYLESC